MTVIKSIITNLKIIQLSYVLGIVLVTCVFLLIYVRIQITVVGYEIGKLKDQESSLLEAQGELKVKLAQLTTQSALLARINQPESTSHDSTAETTDVPDIDRHDSTSSAPQHPSPAQPDS